MDSTDLKILEILQEDGRISMKDLGKMVGLTSPAVSERVKRLEESGVIIGYKAIVNPKKLNKNISAFIDVAIRAEKYKKFLEFVPTVDSIVECHHITGGDCMTLKVIIENMDELEKLIDDIKRFGDTKTSIILSSPIECKKIL
ncbi:Lrp/AsnC family transcriptional regulator, leucine-responsive regulatory protein [Caminicella sporogenes DSM 14501]|uniref:Lrp/AsnC family transcriptional regulator, leucine-responsive regulatory protein n=1 Tax=Caminicella sporogenes DSM 14501 TaxID=1121266 RepID=A0A1M6MJQ9_9FIRM|nr:Lrp/AsnC family transcriptional regulator [Caminicella sporogenes]RKD27527.1 AsnC family transcriptional regulator [Caminicella sporogenes]WIF94899.1 Lrp/AsnC family transcriptional regulator [Caminicella sporogenes]SHJ83513.1 Lrp/AsnC family transcriptional regulator, leucine-responsive regulatory protein [Caminicella sporogenes DSM 14501]